MPAHAEHALAGHRHRPPAAGGLPAEVHDQNGLSIWRYQSPHRASRRDKTRPILDSRRIGSALRYRMTSAVAVKVIVGTKTLSPSLMRFASQARWRAAVPELTPQAYRAPTFSANFFSNSKQRPAVVSQPDSRSFSDILKLFSVAYDPAERNISMASLSPLHKIAVSRIAPGSTQSIRVEVSPRISEYPQAMCAFSSIFHKLPAFGGGSFSHRLSRGSEEYASRVSSSQ